MLFTSNKASFFKKIDRFLFIYHLFIIYLLFIYYLFIYLFIYLFRKGGKKRGREILMWEKHRVVALYQCPKWVPNLPPRHVPCPGIERTTFQFADQHPTKWATLVRARLHFSPPICFILFCICNLFHVLFLSKGSYPNKTIK